MQSQLLTFWEAFAFESMIKIFERSRILRCTHGAHHEIPQDAI